MLSAHEISELDALRIPDWSHDGSVIAFSHGYRIHIVSSDGMRLQPLSDKAPPKDPLRVDYSPDISPSGARIAFTTLKHPTLGRSEAWTVPGEGRRNTFDIVTANLDGSNEQRLREGGSIGDGEPTVGLESASIAPLWAPAGTRIAFCPRGTNIRSVYM